jgi:hypothetical protein
MGPTVSDPQPPSWLLFCMIDVLAICIQTPYPRQKYFPELSSVEPLFPHKRFSFLRCIFVGCCIINVINIFHSILARNQLSSTSETVESTFQSILGIATTSMDFSKQQSKTKKEDTSSSSSATLAPPSATDESRTDNTMKSSNSPPPSGDDVNDQSEFKSAASSSTASKRDTTDEMYQEKKTPTNNNQDTTFPQQLMDLIESVSSAASSSENSIESGEKVIEWLPAGNAFIIRDKAKLEDIMMKYFNAKCKYMSFVRKLYR